MGDIFKSFTKVIRNTSLVEPLIAVLMCLFLEKNEDYADELRDVCGEIIGLLEDGKISDSELLHNLLMEKLPIKNMNRVTRLNLIVLFSRIFEVVETELDVTGYLEKEEIDAWMKILKHMKYVAEMFIKYEGR